MRYLPWVPVASALGFGLSAAALAWWLGRLLDAVPPEDRSYRDRPPLGFRLGWWPIRWMSHYLGPALRISYRDRLLGRLRLAGLDYALAPEEFLSGRILLATGSALLVDVAMTLAGQSSSLWPWSAAAAGYALPAIWLRDRVHGRRRQTLKALPFLLDVITLCVEAGLHLNGAIAQAVAKGPEGALRDELARVLRDMRAGRGRVDALRAFADRMDEPSITHLVSALIQAENLGMSLGPIMRAQSDQCRAERFARAEKLAMEAPVKMLFPLIAFIFPCTFVVLGFPIAMKFMYSGI